MNGIRISGIKNAHIINSTLSIKYNSPNLKKSVMFDSIFYHNSRSYIGTAKFKYLTTELFELNYIYCDEMRIELAAPQIGYVEVDGRKIYYMYFVLDSRSGAFLEFLTDGTFNFCCRGLEAPFILYRNNLEKKEFEEYLSNNVKELDAMPDSELIRLKQREVERSGISVLGNPNEMLKVATLHREWGFN